MHNLGEIRDEVIRKGFPELMPEDIQVGYKKLKDALFQYGGLTGEGYDIEVDKSLEGAPKEVLIGGFAHEFSHILTDEAFGEKIKIRDKLARRISPRYKILDERNSDLQVILRGFGRELLELLKYSEKKGFPHYKEDGLSIREVENILRLKQKSD